jgi:predicted dinucleotide-binding enzyme
MKIAFIGYGQVGSPLADHLARQGHEVTLASASADSESVRKALARNSQLQVAPAEQAVSAADVVFLATPFAANEAALKPVAALLKGKVLVDCTNPVGPGLTHGLKSEQSGSAVVQKLENSAYPGYNVKPVMMYCGNEGAAKQTVGELIAQLGWEPLDVGGLEQAVHLEHMTLLWVRLVRAKGHTPNLVWAALRR